MSERKAKLGAAAVCLTLALAAAPADADEIIDGSPCHMGPYPMTTGTIVEQWHCHNPPDYEAKERHRKNLCVARLKKLRWALDLFESAYARTQLAEDCADRETTVGRHICDGARKEYEASMAGKRVLVEDERRRAAKVCAPGDMI